MAGKGTTDAGGTTRPYGNLHSRVTIGFYILDLGDAIGGNLNHRNRNGNTIIGKYTSHTALAADNTNRHVANLSVYGAFTRYGRPFQIGRASCRERMYILVVC